METFSLQPQTLIALADLVKQWNQDPISYHNSLVITGNHVTVTNGKDILLSVQFPTENENQNHSTEIELHEEPETVNEETTPLLPSSELLTNEIQTTVLETDAVLKELIKDLTEDKQNTPLRESPLLTFAWQDQASEIINWLNQEIRGSQREKQI